MSWTPRATVGEYSTKERIMTSTSAESTATSEYTEAAVRELLVTLLRDAGPLTIAQIRARIVPQNAWPEDRRVIRATAHRLAMDETAMFAYDQQDGTVRLRN